MLKWKKQDSVILRSVPNLLSVIRILLSLTLLLFFKQNAIFMTLYLATGLTDALDGYLARKLDAQTSLGAKLDSVGDFFMYTILIIYLYTEHRIILNDYLYYILLIFGIRIFNVIIGFVKFKTLTMIHTIGNKVSGLLVFLTPVLIILSTSKLLPFICGIALFSALEETVILIISNKNTINLNRKSIFTT